MTVWFENIVSVEIKDHMRVWKSADQSNVVAGIS